VSKNTTDLPRKSKFEDALPRARIKSFRRSSPPIIPVTVPRI